MVAEALRRQGQAKAVLPANGKRWLNVHHVGSQRIEPCCNAVQRATSAVRRAATRSSLPDCVLLRAHPRSRLPMQAPSLAHTGAHTPERSIATRHGCAPRGMVSRHVAWLRARLQKLRNSHASVDRINEYLCDCFKRQARAGRRGECFASLPRPSAG